MIQTVIKCLKAIGAVASRLDPSRNMATLPLHKITHRRLGNGLIIVMHEYLAGTTDNLFVERKGFRVGRENIPSRMQLNLRDYVDRRCYYLNDNVAVGWVAAHLLTPSDVFVDVGANIGHTVVLTAPYVKEVFAFEPEPYNCEKLRYNVALNDLCNVQIIQEGLSVQGGELQLWHNPDNDGAHSVEKTFLERLGYEATTPISVRVRRFDDVGIRNASCVKIDVEGHELPVLMGMECALQAINCLFVETTDKDLGEVVAMLAGKGFEAKAIDPYSGGFAPMRRSHPNYVGTVDLFFYRDKWLRRQLQHRGLQGLPRRL